MSVIISLLASVLLTAPISAVDTVKLDNRTYIGELPSGQGKLYHQDRGLFVGSFNRTVPQGRGIRIKADGSIYSGNFVKPQKPELTLTDDDFAFLESLGYGQYDSRPVFGDGASFFQAYIHPNFRYKESMVGKIATVHYQFVVGEDGKLRDIKIVSSTDEEFSKELLRVLKRSPRWQPAMKDGKPVPYLIKNQEINFNGSE